MTGEEDRVFRDVQHFAADCLRRPAHEIRPETTLAADLCLLGDDAGEFMDAYSHRFQVDFSGFEFDRYFPHEGGVGPIHYIIRKKLDLPGCKFEPVTIRDLVDAVKRGKW